MYGLSRFCIADPHLQPAGANAHTLSSGFIAGESVLSRSLSRPLPSAAGAGAVIEERWVPARVRAARADGGYDLDVDIDGAVYQRAAVPASDLRRPPLAAQPGGEAPAPGGTR